MKHWKLVILALVALAALIPIAAGAITNPDALNGLIETLKAIGKLGEPMVEAYIQYLGAL